MGYWSTEYSTNCIVPCTGVARSVDYLVVEPDTSTGTGTGTGVLRELRIHININVPGTVHVDLLYVFARFAVRNSDLGVSGTTRQFPSTFPLVQSGPALLVGKPSVFSLQSGLYQIEY